MQPGAGAAARTAGDTATRFRGESMVHLANPTAMLEDAAEELSFAQAEKVETRLSKRKIGEARTLKSFAAEQAQKYLEQVPDLERTQKLEDFAQRILGKNRGDGQSREDLREAAEQFSEDVSHQFLALEFLRGEAAKAGAPADALAAIEGAIADLRGDHAPAILAGLNVSRAARDFAPDGAEDLGPLRNLYRDVVLDYDSVRDAYDKIRENHAAGDLKGAVNFLLKGLGADLGSGNSSLSPVRLKAILDDMDKLKSLVTLHDDCADLLGRVQKQGDGGNAAGVTPDEFMGEVLDVQARGWRGGGMVSNLPEKLRIASGEPEIYFLQGFKELMRSMPVKVFDGDMTRRERLMQTVQEAIDTAIDNEWGEDD